MIYATTRAFWHAPLSRSWSNLGAVLILENLHDRLDSLADAIVDRVLERLASAAQLVTIDELARATSLSTATLRRLLSGGKIPAVRIGASVRFNVADVVNALKQSSGGAV
jgi:excisionase family DNA binding protein